MSPQWTPAEGRRIRFQVFLDALAHRRLRCCCCMVLPRPERLRARRVLRLTRRIVRSWGAG